MGRRDRLVTLAGVGAVHLVLLIVLVSASHAPLKQLVEQPTLLITVSPSPLPAAPARSSEKPAAAPAARRSSSSSAKPKRAAPDSLPAIAPVAVAAEADVNLGVSLSSGASLGSIGTGFGLGGGTDAGLSRHAAWIGGGISNHDYPVEAQRAGLQGVVDVRVIVMTDGRVRNCTIDHSSGSAELDRLTCELVEQRLLFSPALDAAGKPFEEVSGRRFRYVVSPRRR